MQINNNREMRVLEDKRRALIKELDAATDLYTEAVKGFMLCPRSIINLQTRDNQIGSFTLVGRCNELCGQCNGTGWVKK